MAAINRTFTASSMPIAQGFSDAAFAPPPVEFQVGATAFDGADAWNAAPAPAGEPVSPRGIDPLQNPKRPGYLMNYAEDEAPSEMVLRKLACWLGVGGYNAPKVDADLFHDKIMDGIRMLLNAATPPAPAATPSAADFARECADTDQVLRLVGLDPEVCRTDGGSLNLPRIRELLKAGAPSEEARDAARWRAALADYEAGTIMGRDEAGKPTGYISRFLEAIRERVDASRSKRGRA